MTLDSLGIWLGAFAGLVGAYFLFVDWREKRKQRAKPEVAPVDKKPLWTPNRRFGFLAITVALAWAVTLFNFANREWLSIPPPPETPLGTNNARIDVIRWQPIINPQKQYAFNLFLTNDGKSDALEWDFSGLTLSGGIPDKDLLDALFLVLRRKLKQSHTESEMRVGQSDQFVSVPNIPPLIQLDDNSLQAYKDGKLPIFALVVFGYRDHLIPSGKRIYSEKCVFAIQDVIHNCAVHNHVVIAD